MPVIDNAVAFMWSDRDFSWQSPSLRCVFVRSNRNYYILWLFEDNLTAAINLRKEDEIRGVDASRLISPLAGQIPPSLARSNSPT